MELVTSSNKDQVPYRNVRELLLANSNGYKVVPMNGGKTTSIPVYSVDNEVRIIKRRTGKSVPSYIVTMTINCIGETYERCNDMLQEARDLLDVDNKCDVLSSYNMNYNDEITNNSLFTRSGKTYKVRVLVLQFAIL